MIEKTELGKPFDSPPTPLFQLPGNITLEILQSGKKYFYILKDEYNNEIINKDGPHPSSITDTSTIGKELKRILDPEGRLKPPALKEDFTVMRQALIQYWQDKKNYEQELLQQKNSITQEELDKRIKEALNTWKNKEHPVIYINSLIKWITAGEEQNILLAFFIYASQVILKNPISLVGLGEGSSGKDHIEESALSMIPDMFIEEEKDASDKMMFRTAQHDEWFYDGKIVRYGDLGGENAQDDVIAAKNILKEMLSRGEVRKRILVPSEGDWDIVTLHLKGYPCLTYTTVPGWKFDDQELSRSFLITPRQDNRDEFMEFKKVLHLKGRSYYQHLEMKEKISQIPYVVLHLREVMETTDIINPYGDLIDTYIGESSYFKRDYDKLNGILRSITALHAVTRTHYEVNYSNKKVIFTTKDDIKIFITLLERYHASIASNISPKAVEILNNINSSKTKWFVEDETHDKLIIGVTVNDYLEKIDTSLSKRSIQRYFGELNDAGLLKVIDKRGYSNVYSTTVDELEELTEKLTTLTPSDSARLLDQLDGVILKQIEQDQGTPGLSLDVMDHEIPRPPWG